MVLSSDDEEGLVDSQEQTKKKNHPAKVPNPTRPERQVASEATKTGSPGPQVAQRPTQKPKNGTSTRQISTFFTAIGQSTQQAKRVLSTARHTGIGQLVVKDAEAGDAIEEVSDNEKSNKPRPTQDTAKIVLDHRRIVDELGYNVANPSQQGRLPSGSQIFRLPSSGNRYGGDLMGHNNVNQRPWAEKFAPSNLEELAIHKKKVSNVRSWLEKVLSGQSLERLLILKGPAGTGKTVTLKMLANAMKLDLSEWKNPVGSDYLSEGYISMSANFEDFLGRSGKFNTLEIDGMPNDNQIASPSDSLAQKVILIEDFPNTSFSTSTALHSFRSTILQYLAASTPSKSLVNAKGPSQGANITPVVIIITETRVTSKTASNDIFTVNRLLGLEILNHPAVNIIEFNPVAPTFIRKALDLVVQKEARLSGRRRVPGSSMLAKLCEVGDVRNAIGSLQFLCVRAQDGDDWGGKVAASAKRGGNAPATMTDMERDSLESVSQRENSLGLFHAVGKVVYNKRDDFGLTPIEDPETKDPLRLLDHQQERMPRGPPKASLDHLIDETGTDCETFIAALHENYVMSCEGPTLIDALDGCLDAFSDGDLLGSSRYPRTGDLGSKSHEAASESLRRDEIAFQLVVRGLFLALPNPVKRSARPMGVHGRSGGKGDSYKMFYPVSMRLAKQTEQIEFSIDQWYRRLRTTMAFRSEPLNAGRHPLKFYEINNQHSDSKDQAPFAISIQEHQKPFRTSLICTKAELALEKLPYVTKIEQANPSSGYLCELEALTQFRGVDLPGDEASEDEGVENPPSVGAQSNALPATRQIRTAVDESLRGVISDGEEIGKLYLSDDDIED